MNKDKVLKRINEIVIEEKGVPVDKNSLFTDTQLDSLGTMIVLATIDAEFKPFKEGFEKWFSSVDINTLTIRDVINKCILSNA